MNAAIEKNKRVEVIYYDKKQHKMISGLIQVKDNSIIVGGKNITLYHIIDINIGFLAKGYLLIFSYLRWEAFSIIFKKGATIYRSMLHLF